MPRKCVKLAGFCVVSSDSDYTRLCMRIRESGLFVMGIGRENTPEAFINACNVFVYVENLIQSDQAQEPDEVKAPTTLKAPSAVKQNAVVKTSVKAHQDASKNALLNLLRRAFDISAQDDDGWVHLGALGNALHRIESSFDSRTYGFKSLLLLIKSMPQYIVVKGAKKTGPSVIYVRMKDDLP